MKAASRSRRPGGRPGQGRSEPQRPPGGKGGLAFLIAICAVAAIAAFWITRTFLPSRTVVVSSNTVTIPAVPPKLTLAPPPGGATVPGTAAATTSPPSIDMGTPPPIDTNDPVQLVNRGTEYLERGMVDPAIEH